MFKTTVTSDKYLAKLISEPFTKLRIRQTVEDYRRMLLSILTAILDRYESDPAYHFIDTKLSLITGKDFDCDDHIRGKGMIYSWIQGRGLEALAGHDIWLGRCKNIDEKFHLKLSSRIRIVLSEVVDQMEKLRKRNGGRLFFMMTPDGTPSQITKDGTVAACKLTTDPPSNYSDLFYAKGLAAAAYVLGRNDKLSEACHWFLTIAQDLNSDKFTSDQQQLDPRNIAAKHAHGRYAHGPRMIAIGAVARFLKCTKNSDIQKTGFDFLDHILTYHINNENDAANKYDMWEFIDKGKKPYVSENGILLSDPGHACEFVGLAFDLIRTCELNDTLTTSQKNKIAGYKEILPRILQKNFANGFSQHGFGICKGFDLTTRKIFSSDMPWWSLPETMRASLFACGAVPSEECPKYAHIAAQCSNAFVSHYVKPVLNCMAFQTLNKDGKPVDVIPATPDADPGYHTGLSIIDCLELCQNYRVPLKIT